MSEPLHKNDNDALLQESEQVRQVLRRLSAKYFTGNNAVVLDKLLAAISFKGNADVLNSVLLLAKEHVERAQPNITDIEQLELEPIAKKIAEGLELENTMQLSTMEATNFDEAARQFGRALLHDVAFPLIALENPNDAIAAKNMLKRVLTGLAGEADLAEMYEVLDIENLPTTFTRAMFEKFGGRLPGLHDEMTEAQTPVIPKATFEKVGGAIPELDDQIITEPRTPVNPNQTVLYCELSHEQAIYLAYNLQYQYQVISNWRQFYHLLMSNGKRYDSVIVNSKKKGMFLCVLRLLHERKHFNNARYLYTSKTNGIWPFFQGFLIDSKTQQTFQRDLRKICSEFKRRDEAQSIIDELFDPKQQLVILERAREWMKKL